MKRKIDSFSGYSIRTIIRGYDYLVYPTRMLCYNLYLVPRLRTKYLNVNTL